MLKKPSDVISQIHVRFYGASIKSVNTASFRFLGIGIAPSVVANNLVNLTQEWKDFKIDVIVYFQNRNIIKIVIDPSTSVMVLRASTANIKSFSERNLITGQLGKGGYEVKQREKAIKLGNMAKPKPYKYYGAHITLENVYRIAKQISKKSLSNTFKGTVKQVLGTVDTLGITVDEEHPQKIIEKLDCDHIVIPNEDDIIPLLDEFGQPVNIKKENTQSIVNNIIDNSLDENENFIYNINI